MTKRDVLQESARWFDSDIGIMSEWGEFRKRLMSYRFRTIRQWLCGERCLELGTADGESTQHLFEFFDHVVSVEGAAYFVEQVKHRFKDRIAEGRFKVNHALFEEFESEEAFDVVLANLVLEHADDPVGLLQMIQRFLAPWGRLIIIVPNADSLHRQVAVKMGLLTHVEELSAQDLRLGHQRVYRPDTLREDVLRSGFHIIHQGGILLKPLTNRQIQAAWTPEMIDGFFGLGHEYPDISAEIFVICRMPGSGGL